MTICTLLAPRTVCRAGSVKRYGVRPASVCPSVCPIMGPQQQTHCCSFGAVGPAGRRYQSIASAVAADLFLSNSCIIINYGYNY